MVVIIKDMILAKIRRLVLFYLMVVSGIVIAFTGILLYLWPHGPKSLKMVVIIKDMILAKIRRLVLFYLMVVSGIVIAFTGILLYLWPHGPKSGQLVILGFQKTFWQDVHTYAAVFGVVVILLHLIENRRCVRLYIRETLKGV